MKKLATLFTDSYLELKQVKTITTCAMFAAIAIVLGTFSTLQIGNTIRIGFSNIPNELVDYLFGPVAGGVFGGVLDVMKYVIKPSGPFFPGFTVSAVLGAVIYGCVLYRRPLTFWRIAAAKLAVCLVVNVLLNTLWLSMLYGDAFVALLPVRFFKNAVMWPIDSLILYTVGKALENTGVMRIIKNCKVIVRN